MNVHVDISRQDYADFNKAHFFRTRFLRSLATVCITLLVLQFVLYNQYKPSVLNIIVSSLVFIVIYACLVYYRLEGTRNVPVENGSILGKREFLFNDEGITCKAGTNTSHSTWATVKKFYAGKTAFYIYVDTNMAYIIPRRDFTGPEQQSEFITLVTNLTNLPSPVKQA